MWKGEREHHLDLLLMRAIGIVDRRAQPAGEGIRPCVGSRAGSSHRRRGSRCGPAASRGSCPRSVITALAFPASQPIPIFKRGVQRRLVGELLELVLLPFRGAGQQDERRRADERDQRHRDQDHHLAGLRPAPPSLELHPDHRLRVERDYGRDAKESGEHGLPLELEVDDRQLVAGLCEPPRRWSRRTRGSSSAGWDFPPSSRAHR